MGALQVNCRDKCGAETADASAAGWTLLSVAGGWRCGKCVATLLNAGALIGPDSATVDALQPDSIGALRKATAHTISPVSVKG